MPPETNILYLITEFDTGGAETMLYELASRVDRKKFKVSACCLTGRGPIGEKLSAAGVKVFYLDMKGKWDFPALFRLIKLLKKYDVKILHTFLFHANFMGRIAGRIAGVPAVISSVRVSEKQQFLHVLGEKLTHPLSDVILCVSEAVMKFMEENGIPREKMRVVPNGIDLEKFSLKYDVQEVKKELGIPADAKVIGTVSRLTPQKRVDRFLDCASIILKKIPGVYFIIAGRGELESRLKRHAEKTGVFSNTRFLGFREDSVRVMSIFDVFMLTSSWEGMPVALLEAMAMGKPVVASAVEGSSEVLAGGESGFLVPPEDIEAFAGRAVGLLKDGVLAEKTGKNARERAGEYSVREMVRKNEAVYGEFAPKFS